MLTVETRRTFFLPLSLIAARNEDSCCKIKAKRVKQIAGVPFLYRLRGRKAPLVGIDEALMTQPVSRRSPIAKLIFVVG